MAETQRDIAEYQSDHDLLIVLNERVGNLVTAVEKKNGDHEARIRWLENRGWFLSGAVLAASTLINYLLQIFHHQ